MFGIISQFQNLLFIPGNNQVIELVNMEKAEWNAKMMELYSRNTVAASNPNNSEPTTSISGTPQQSSSTSSSSSFNHDVVPAVVLQGEQQASKRICLNISVFVLISIVFSRFFSF